jgi:Circadian oscillating protein COP23
VIKMMIRVFYTGTKVDMKRSVVWSVLSASILTYVATAVAPVGASGENGKFYCGKNGNVPTTMAKTSRGDVAVIRWVSRGVFGDAYPPEVRCNIVSEKFQSFYQDGTLDFLTTGVVNRMSVICVAQAQDGPCNGVLFTLKPGGDPGRTLKLLLGVRIRSSGPIAESSATRVYIKMKDFLDTAPVVSATPMKMKATKGLSTPVKTKPTSKANGDRIW